MFGKRPRSITSQRRPTGDKRLPIQSLCHRIAAQTAFGLQCFKGEKPASGPGPQTQPTRDSSRSDTSLNIDQIFLRNGSTCIRHPFVSEGHGFPQEPGRLTTGSASPETFCFCLPNNLAATSSFEPVRRYQTSHQT